MGRGSMGELLWGEVGMGACEGREEEGLAGNFVDCRNIFPYVIAVD